MVASVVYSYRRGTLDMKYFLLMLLVLLGCNTINSTKQEIVFVMTEDDITKYPKIVAGIEQARKEWSEALGIDIAIISGEPNLTSVHLDIRDNLTFIGPEVIGAWMEQTNSLVLDSSFIDSEDIARAVTLHEMGHYFGVPHLESDETLIMHPVVSVKNLNSKLHPVEIRIAHAKLFR